MSGAGSRVVSDSAASDRNDPWVVTIDLPFIRSALLRRRLVLLLATVVGGLVGLGAAFMAESGSQADVTLLLSHDAAQDPDDAAATDLGLLRTRALAETVIGDRNLAMSPEEFVSTVSVAESTGQLLRLVVAAPDDDAAVERVEALARLYLEFRADVLTDQVDALIGGYEDRIELLQEQSAAVQDELSDLRASPSSVDAVRQNEVIAERAAIVEEIDLLQQSIDNERIRLAAVVDASRVIDPAAAISDVSLLRLAIGGAAGAFAALALASVGVLAIAIFMDRPRRRAEVAHALDTKVLVSVGRLRGRLGSSREARRHAAERLAQFVLAADEQEIALLGVLSERDTVSLGADLVKTMAADGAAVTCIDLTRRGGLAAELGTTSITLAEWQQTAGSSAASSIRVVRPGHTESASTLVAPSPQQPHRSPSAGGSDDPPVAPDLVPVASHGAWNEGSESTGRAPSTTRRHARHARPGPADGVSPRPGAATTLVVGELDPALGAYRFAQWAGAAVLVVRAGAASTELLTSAARQVQGSGMRLLGAVLTRSDRTDDSVGEPPRPSRPTSHPDGRRP